MPCEHSKMVALGYIRMLIHRTANFITTQGLYLLDCHWHPNISPFTLVPKSLYMIWHRCPVSCTRNKQNVMNMGLIKFYIAPVACLRQ